MNNAWRGGGLLLSGLSMLWLCESALAAEPPGPGARPVLAEAPAAGGAVTGWRGDGTGKYPAADPPVTWSRISTAMQGLRFSAAAPGADETGTAMADGVVREWLVLGPVPLAQPEPANDDSAKGSLTPEEAALAPMPGQETSGRRWQKVTLDTAYLDFMRLLGKPPAPNVVAYAFTRLYAPAAGKFRVNLTCGGSGRLSLNGKKPATIGGRETLDLAPGWNRLLLRVTPAESDWYAVAVFHGQGRGEYQEQGIAWRTPLPGVHPGFYGGGMGVGSPVIVGDSLYLLSEPNDLICLSKTDGKVRWVRRASYFEAATATERQDPAYAEAQALVAKLDAISAAFVAGAATPAQLQDKAKLEKDLQKQMKRIDPAKYQVGNTPDVGYSGLTPVTDGRCVYAWFTNGVSVCFDLDGTRRWIRVDPRREVEHGFSSSPLLVDGKLVVFMRDLLAFDAGTGKLAWQTPVADLTGLNPSGWFHGSPAAATIGGVKVIILGNGMIVRAGDGQVLGKEAKLGIQSVSSPMVDGRQLFQVSTHTMELHLRTLPDTVADPLAFRALPTRTIALDTKAFPKHYVHWVLASPLVHDGLVYLLNNAGVLSVLEAQSGTVVYQKLLDLDVFQTHNEGAARGVGISPALAGKYLYLVGNNGAALVLEPGRTYRQVAKNKLESVVALGHWAERQERFVANPVFDGKRLYLRGEESVYALGPR